MGIPRLINLFMAVGTHTREQTLKHLAALCQKADRLHQASVNQTTDVGLFCSAISPTPFSHDVSVLDISGMLPLSQFRECQRYLQDTVI